MSAPVPILKAHGLGNDFLLVAAEDAPAGLSDWARRICDRHTGVGADGVLLYTLAGPERAGMRLLNADGSEAEISGNGLRCLSACLVRDGRLARRHSVATLAGVKAVSVEPLPGAPSSAGDVPADGRQFRVTCDLGEPILASSAIPVRLEPPRTPVVAHELDIAGRRVSVTATSMGNPHCAVFVAEPPDDGELCTLGPLLERHAFFPRRTNVEFVTVVGRGELRVRFWERGVGYTRASGTGAASAAVAAVLNGHTDRSVAVVCDGGTLSVEWPADGPLRQTGDVEVVFAGDWLGA